MLLSNGLQLNTCLETFHYTGRTGFSPQSSVVSIYNVFTRTQLGNWATTRSHRPSLIRRIIFLEISPLHLPQSPSTKFSVPLTYIVLNCLINIMKLKYDWRREDICLRLHNLPPTGQGE